MKLATVVLPLSIFVAGVANAAPSAEDFNKDIKEIIKTIETIVVETGITKSTATNTPRLSQKEKVQLEKVQKDYLAAITKLENLNLEYRKLLDANLFLQENNAQQTNAIKQLEADQKNTMSNVQSLQLDYFEKLKEAKNIHDARQTTLQDQLCNNVQALCSKA